MAFSRAKTQRKPGLVNGENFFLKLSALQATETLFQ